MDISSLFNAGLLLSGATYLFYQLKGIPKIIFEQIKKRIVYTVNVEETSILYNYIEEWLIKHYKESYRNVRADINVDSIRLRHFSDIFSIKFNGKRIFINKGREKFENAGDIRSAFYNNFKIYGVAAKKHISLLLEEILQYNKSITKHEQYIYTNNQHGEWSYVCQVKGKSVDSIILKDKQAVIDDVADFISKEEWYNTRGIPYKRGLMFYGSPGNGKTSFALALAKKFNRNIYFLNLNDLEKDAKLVEALARVENNSIIAIEDIDAAFSNRDGNVKVSFSCLLNCLDGALSINGCIIIMTTNHIDKIDCALLRNGRIDKKIEISNPDKLYVEKYLSLFYDQEIRLSSYTKELPMSSIQEICLTNKNNKQKAIEVLTKEDINDKKNV